MGKEELKKAGLKVTNPRLKILQLFELSQTKHLSAEDIYRQCTDDNDEIAIATIYRVLTQFESAGILVRHHFDEGHSVFELSHDEHHDHIVCVKCHKVEEFMDEQIEERQNKIAQEMGYTITSHSLCLYGICKNCQQKAGKYIDNS